MKEMVKLAVAEDNRINQHKVRDNLSSIWIITYT